MSEGNLFWEDTNTKETRPAICAVCDKGRLIKIGCTITCPNKGCEANKESGGDE